MRPRAFPLLACALAACAATLPAPAPSPAAPPPAPTPTPTPTPAPSPTPPPPPPPSPSPSPPPPASPPLLLRNGTLHTLDPAHPLADSALVLDGRFACVGPLATCAPLAPPSTRVLDLRGGSATPGLADAHLHVRSLGRMLVDLDLRGATSEADAVARARARAATLPPGTWVRGRGWDQTRWPGQAWPGLATLSAALPDHPAYLRRIDGHASWVNARALALAGIDDRTPDPPGGRILRDARGHPTGVLVDDADALVAHKLPPLTAEETADALLAALQTLRDAGLTAVHDLGVSPETLAVWRALAAQDRLPLRVFAALDDAPLAALAPRMEDARLRGATGRLEVGAVKLYADGALGSRGALLSEPYADEPGNSGLAVLSQEELTAKVRAIAAAGLVPAIHCIGDLGCARALRAFAAVRREHPALRPRAEHLQVLHPRDAPLLAASGAVASMQPVHLTSDGPWVDARLGAASERARGAYAWRQALDAGAALACGSDAPNDDFDPRQGLLALETRRWPGGPAQSWHPEQRLSRLEGLRCYTQGPAFAAGAEVRRGRIAVGQEADLTCFAKDVLAVPAAELATLQVICAVVAGRVELAR